MNDRIFDEPTPEGRIAAACRTLWHRMREDAARRGKPKGDYSSEADYADYRDALRPYVQRELTLARIDELKSLPGPESPGLVFRLQDLRRYLEQLNRDITAAEEKKPPRPPKPRP